MLGKSNPGQSLADQACRRCAEPSVIVVRAEPLCRECFLKYVQTKTIKRMETFRVRHSSPLPTQQRKLLLPISFGASSVSLLHILHFHLSTQKAKSGRTGYSLSILFVDCRSVDPTGPSPELLEKLKERYPEHEYTSVRIEDIFSPERQQSDQESSLLELIPLSPSSSPLEKLSVFLNHLPSSSSRADVLYILLRRLILSTAKLQGCTNILYGDSTTTLAVRTLSETAKGRGFSLPWVISDSASPSVLPPGSGPNGSNADPSNPNADPHGIPITYPLRDVLKKELVAYTERLDPPLTPLLHDSSARSTKTNMSSKNTTIDDLMRNYFEGVEEGFPAIVSNVVRTSSKLEVPRAGRAAGEGTCQSVARCSLCAMPVADGRFGIYGWGGDQQDGLVSSEQDQERRLCYGCTRAMGTAAGAQQTA